MENSLKKIVLRTKHFIASVDVDNRTWQLTGEFLHEVRTIPDNPWGGDLLREEIQELYDLENAIRSMIGIKAPETEGTDGVRLHPVSEG